MVTLPEKQSQFITSESQISGKKIHHQIVIIGGGAAGVTSASLLLIQNPSLDIAIIEPAEKHYYQPGWTMVGGGVFQLQDTVRNEQDLIPQDVKWIKDYAVKLDPDNNRVLTKEGLQVEYDYLIVCPGIQINWHLIKGLKEAIGKNGVTSNYSSIYAPYTWELIKNFQGGNAIFTYPNTPIKCGGAPQKIMYMADDMFRKSGVRERTNVIYCTTTTKMFFVPEYSDVLDGVVAKRNIQVKFRCNLKEIKADSKEAIFDLTKDDETVEEITLKYDMIHVAPPQSAPDFIKESPLAIPNNPFGWVDVNKDTLQHNRYSNVFALGDASSLPTSKTAAAIRRQAPVLVENLLALITSQPLNNRYNGYTCCPLITGYNKLVMAEFDGYTFTPMSSFPFNPAKERWSMWVMKKNILPWVYWNRMLKGQQFEGDYIKFMQWKKQK
ncbi:pyridine nucleotide-disulfide oxidoreductase [[Phormidium ambiguum] IAM M-71]|uniref:Pyridine nucleotide-disulfide oxidoreductase n=1 Tax=[Phormidium ambiguum] IAM M-71 TaxID=454136 RepID=A0A1U7INE5_9CYAN|nr:FAD/NAD(P)-binding oxidoreductase [Phormidium ambiguum]OKH38805.1 pyridine nucleotide-disulfide oxidoreductase [Phormidium ambiguum IAM M-71]